MWRRGDRDIGAQRFFIERLLDFYQMANEERDFFA